MAQPTLSVLSSIRWHRIWQFLLHIHNCIHHLVRMSCHLQSPGLMIFVGTQHPWHLNVTWKMPHSCFLCSGGKMTFRKYLQLPRWRGWITSKTFMVQNYWMNMNICILCNFAVLRRLTSVISPSVIQFVKFIYTLPCPVPSDLPQHIGKMLHMLFIFSLFESVLVYPGSVDRKRTQTKWVVPLQNQ